MTGRMRALGLALVLILAVAGFVYATAGDEPPGELAATPRPSVTVPSVAPSSSSEATELPATRAAGVTLTDGIYAVGSEIQPGVYSTTAGAHPCYWARLRSFGQNNSIVDEDNLEPGEHARVVVKATDRGFKVSNGCTWHQAL